MPTYGTCQMCKETAYLTAKVLRNKETGSLHLGWERLRDFLREKVKDNEL